jgi:hypothetical protein
MVLWYWAKLYTNAKNLEALFMASDKVGLELNIGKSEYIFMSPK